MEMKEDFLYEIKIEFEEHPINPSNIFYCMGELVESVGILDNVLVSSLPYAYESSIRLESLEVGSIKAKLKTVLENIDDEALKEIEWRKLIGSFLVRAKYKIIERIDKPINTNDDVRSLTDSISKIANEEFGDNNIKPNISKSRLLDALRVISESMKQLKSGEEAIYISSEGAIIINKDFNLSQGDIELLLTEEEVSSTTKEILTVKKPDYLGKSKWECYQNQREKVIHVKVLDNLWLMQFQSGKIDLRPGDSIETSLETIISLDSDMREVSSSHSIHKVYRIIRDEDYKFEQLTLS